MKINTKCIHQIDHSEKQYPFGSITTPIYQTSTYLHPGIGETTGHNYTRESNPTRDELEKKVSALEGALDTLACTSGMSAISLMLELFERGDHVICSYDLYGGSMRIFDTIAKKNGLEFSYVNTSVPEEVRAAVNHNTKAIFVETPSNPTMRVADLQEIANIGREHHLLLIADNTFLTPYYQRPMEFGFDIVIHSGTKYLAGHNDTMAGFICVNSGELSEKLRFLYKTVGMGISPFDAFLTIRGIKTLAVRMERAQENAMKIAEFLSKHPNVESVAYVGLPTHPGYEISQKQASGFGSMIGFTTDTVERARDMFSRIKVFSYAESLGGVESLATFPMIQTHADVPAKIREELGIHERFIRLSIGIEDVDDLIEDLENALR